MTTTPAEFLSLGALLQKLFSNSVLFGAHRCSFVMTLDGGRYHCTVISEHDERVLKGYGTSSSAYEAAERAARNLGRKRPDNEEPTLPSGITPVRLPAALARLPWWARLLNWFRVRE